MPVPDFSPGEVLTASAMDSIGLWLVKTQTVGTAVSSVEVTGAFSANYDNYRITYTGGVASTATLINLRLGASATGYFSFFVLGSYNAATVSGSQTNNGTTFVHGGVGTTLNTNVDAHLYGPFLTKTTGFSAVYTEHTATTGAGGNVNGFHNVASSFTAFTLIPQSGTLTGGTIRVYGYRN